MEKLTPEAALAFRAARKLCMQSAPDFAFFARLLPRHKQSGACAVISFAQMVRDALAGSRGDATPGARGLREHPAIVSQASCCSGPSLSSDQLLSTLSERLAQIYSGKLELPSPESRSDQQNALCGFALTVSRYEVPLQCFTDLTEAMRSDVSIARHPTVRSFERYLDVSGGSVARAVACVIGMTHSDALTHAAALGKAIRLLWVLQTLATDHARGRVLLPLEDLARYRYSERDLARGTTNDALRALVDAQIRRARSWLDEASGALGMLAGDRERLASAWLIAAGHDRLTKIERRANAELLAPRAFTFRPAWAIRQMPRAWRMTKQAIRVRESQLH